MKWCGQGDKSVYVCSLSDKEVGKIYILHDLISTIFPMVIYVNINSILSHLSSFIIAVAKRFIV